MPTPLSEIIPLELLPTAQITSNESPLSFLERILVTQIESRLLEPDTGNEFILGLSIAEEVVLSFPGLEGVTLVIGGADSTQSEVLVGIAPGIADIRIKGGIRLRFPREWLKPMIRQDGKWINDPSLDYTEIKLNTSLLINKDWNFSFDGINEFTIRPSMIANTGFIIEASVAIDLSENHALPETIAMGLGDRWRGVVFKTLTLHLPSELDVRILPEELTLRNFHIGSGGLNGSVSGNWSPTVTETEISGNGAGSFFGISFGLQNLELELLQNAVTGMEINGILFLPFFNQPIGVNFAITLDGTIGVELSEIQPPGIAYDAGLVKLEIDDVLKITVERLGFEIKNGVFTAKLSGAIQPLFLKDIFDWPSSKINELSIDSHGNVYFDGGWLDIPEKYSIDFYGFQIDITKLGMGKTEDGGKWIGFSGELSLVDGFTAGASVEGLRIIWYDDGRDTKITLNGLGVEFEIPDVLRFKGTVSYRELPDNVHRFDGDIKLELLYLNLQVDGKLVIGTRDGDPFFAIYLGVDLPAGIPLFATGLGIYGFSGLFAHQMEPNKKPEEEWYEGWYKRNPAGIIDLSKKWDYHSDSFALGAGITLGTLSDNGYAFSGKMLMLIVFPGPIVMLEGKSNILRKRSELDKGEPVFRSLAVLDNRAGNFLVNIEALYKQYTKGEIIEISGNTEAFFDFHNASLWHLYIGEKEPKTKRIRAEIFHLLEANSYFMMDSHQVATGAFLGYDKKWKFGPLRVILEAWIEGNAQLSWKPVHFYGDLGLHGKAELSVWGFGAGLMVDANFACDVFEPLHILAKFKVGINLPWPMDDISATIKLEWGPDNEMPPFPLPLKEIAIEHFKTTTSWPLIRGQLLLPNYDENADEFYDGPSGSSLPEESENLPVVPLDCRPHITFGRSMNFDGSIGINPQITNPEYEQIGDSNQKAKYVLSELSLQICNGTDWEIVAKAPHENGFQDLWGSWALVPNMNSSENTVDTEESQANVKLWLWSNTPYDYTRFVGKEWNEWANGQFGNYPCIPIPKDKGTCYDFEKISPDELLTSPWAHPDEPGLVFKWTIPEIQQISILEEIFKDRKHALCFPLDQKVVNLMIDLPETVKNIHIIAKFSCKAGGYILLKSYDKNNLLLDGILNSYVENTITDLDLIIEKGTIHNIHINGNGTLCIIAVCLTKGISEEEKKSRKEMLNHIKSEVAHLSQKGNVLLPYSKYRLKVFTKIYKNNDTTWRELIEYAYFQTDGPPGLSTLTTPVGSPANEEFKSGLEDLSRYVEQTIPATVPAEGEKPFLPRPVYRAYDVSIRFNEDYVDLMYRISRCDLGLYLYDNSNQPIRDAEDRLIILNNHWGTVEELFLTESEKEWIHTLNTRDCLETMLSGTGIPHNKKLESQDEGQVLKADTVYEARLIPLLLHEDFQYPEHTGAELPEITGWQVQDETGVTPSLWKVGSEGQPNSKTYFIEQTMVDAGHSFLITGSENWTDYRMTTILRSNNEREFGICFRFADFENHYLFSMDRKYRSRRLIRKENSISRVLAEDDFVYQKNRDYVVTVEAMGQSIRIYFDGKLLFDVVDAKLSKGKIGLFCGENEMARFSDVRIDDFRKEAPIVYRFKFTTSQFANFFHHLHSYQDETWRKELNVKYDDIHDLVTQAVSSVSAKTNVEIQNFENLEQLLFSNIESKLGNELEITRIMKNE